MTENLIQSFQPLQVIGPTPEPTYQPSNQNKKWDAKLIALSFINLLVNIAISQIVPFYPRLARYDAGLSFMEIGLVISLNPAGAIAFSFICDKVISQIGRKKGIQIALLSQAIVTILFGCLNFMTENKSLFYFLSLTSRFCQGMSRTMISAIIFSYLPLFYEMNLEQKVERMEALTGLGTLFGPIAGSLLNYFFGYSVPFFTIGLFFLLSMIAIQILIPPDSIFVPYKITDKPPFCSAFLSLKVFLTSLNILFVCCGQSYINPIFVNHMLSFGFSENISALVLTIPSFSYLIVMKTFKKMKNQLPRTFMMSFGLLLCTIGNTIEAPFYGLPSSIIPVCFGLMIIGFAQAFSMLPSIPQLIELLQPLMKQQTSKQLIDISSLIFILSVGFGNLFGSLLAGNIYQFFGGDVNANMHPHKEAKAFRSAMLLLSILQLINFTLYLFLADGYRGWNQLCRQQRSNKDQLIKIQKENKDQLEDAILTDQDSEIEE